MPDLGYEDEPIEHVKVAITTIAFNNAKLINLLRKRGVAIHNQKWEEQRKIENQMNDLKAEELESLITPCTVFMSLENEEGVMRAVKFNEYVDEEKTEERERLRKWLGDEELEIKGASEPSDIIWENRHVTNKERFFKAVIVICVIGFALFISFSVIFYLRV